MAARRADAGRANIANGCRECCTSPAASPGQRPIECAAANRWRHPSRPGAAPAADAATVRGGSMTLPVQIYRSRQDETHTDHRRGRQHWQRAAEGAARLLSAHSPARCRAFGHPREWRKSFAPQTSAMRQRSTTAMAGIDCVVHLAGMPTEAPWEEVLRLNIEGCYNVFEAARRGGVRQIVFASSNHAIGFHRRERFIDTNVVPRPDTRYGGLEGVRRGRWPAVRRQIWPQRRLPSHRELPHARIGQRTRASCSPGSAIAIWCSSCGAASTARTITS